MRNETIGVLDLRRNLSALLETTQRRPLMVHRYGSPWVCVVSDAQWQQQAVLLDFDPQSHPLAMLLRLQQQALPLAETGALPPAALARTAADGHAWHRGSRAAARAGAAPSAVALVRGGHPRCDGRLAAAGGARCDGVMVR
jgi:hypothetical protein